MKKSEEVDVLAERPNQDFSKGIRGKYAARIREQGTNVAFIDEDLVEAFPDSNAVNAALRSLMREPIRTPTLRRKTAAA